MCCVVTSVLCVLHAVCCMCGVCVVFVVCIMCGVCDVLYVLCYVYVVCVLCVRVLCVSPNLLLT